MSLINDMLKDLEARRVAPGLGVDDRDHSSQHDGIHAHMDPMHHADATAPIERRAQRHLRWLFWPFVLVLILLAVALYLFVRDQARMIPTSLEPSPTAIVAATPQPAPSAPAPSPTVEPPVEEKPTARPAGPRLAMLVAEGQGKGVRLGLAFDQPLSAPIGLSREGDRIALRVPGVHVEQQASPHVALNDWRSGMTGEDWVFGFQWPADGVVRLQPDTSTDGLQHWQLTLLPAPVAAEETLKPVPVASASVQPPPAPALQARPATQPRSLNPEPALTPAQQAEALYAEAWLLQQKDSMALATDKLQQALRVQPEHARARELLARMMLRAGQSHEAELEVIRGLEVQPRQPDLVELYARMLADQGRVQEARGLLRERMQPDRVAHQSLYALLAARAGDQAQAAEAYRRASELDPRDPRWPLGQAIALENSGQARAAREAYGRALGLEGLDVASRGFVQERLDQMNKGN